MHSLIRSKWAAVGAAVAVTLGAGGVSLTQAAINSGDKPVYVALAEPCRLVDTRPAATIGPKNTPIAAGDTNAYEIQVTGSNGDCTGPLAIPADAVAVATNVTAIAPVATTTGRSFFTVYPADAPLPDTSNLNFLNGQAPVPNKVDVGLSATGTIKIYNDEGTAHAAVDVFGYYIDHGHDDIYYRKSATYSKSEVDAAVATKDDVEAAIDGGNRVFAISTVDDVVASVTVRTPTSGYVIVNSSATATLGGSTIARCSISTTESIDTTALQEQTLTSGTTHTLSGTRGFVVDRRAPISPASRTYHLVCDAQTTGWNLNDPYLTAIFVPDDDPVVPGPLP